ncbi:MAG TPA: TolC family protein, partial [Polyangiaceae bacterium]
IAGPREDAAHALLDETHADLERARRDAAAHAANAWIGVREAEEVLTLRRNVTTQASDLAIFARKRVNAGTSLPSDAAIAEGDLALAQAAELDGEGVVTETLAELRHALALPADADADAVGPLTAAAAPPPGATNTAREGLASSPVVAVAAARARRSESDARLARALAEPTLAVGASFTHEGTGDDIWTAVVQVPIPLSRSGKYDEARQLGQAAAAARDVAVVRAEIQRQIALALHECQHTRETRDAYARALPPLGDAVRMARAQLDAGAVTATVVSVARQRLLEAEERATHATADVLRADVELGRVTGTILRREAGAAP